MLTAPKFLAVVVFAISLASPDAVRASLLFTKLDLNGNFTLSGSGDTSGFPFSNNTYLGRVPFIQTGAFGQVWNANYAANGTSVVSGPQTLTLNTSVADARGFYSIINTWWGKPGPASYASVTFNFADNTSFSQNLIGNVDIRDFNYTGSWTTTINGTTARNVYLRAAGSLPNPYALDRQWFDFGVHSGKTLTSVVFTDTGSSGLQRMLVSGATVQSGQSGQITGPAIGPGDQPIGPIPEPGTWAAAALLVGAAGYARWRRRGKMSGV